MTHSCGSFRSQLQAALVGPADAARLTTLGFHEHIRACAACRELLQREEALELLLASWPHPELAPQVLARLIERLREAQRLELLLDLDQPDAPPAGLAGRVLAHVASRSASPQPDAQTLERRLDALLDLAGEVVVPPELATRVAGGVRREVVASRPRPLPSGAPAAHAWAPARVLRAAAAVLVVVGAVALWQARGVPTEDRDWIPPRELLSVLPVLENWELVIDEGDLDLATGMDFSSGDEALLELASVASGPESGPEAGPENASDDTRRDRPSHSSENRR